VTLDPALDESAGLVEEAAIACREAVASLRRYADSLEADPARQEWLESRLAAFEAAARKHRVEPNDLPDLREQLARELEKLREGAQDLAGLERRLESARVDRDRFAQRLHAARRAAAGKLDARATVLMQGLGMQAGVFSTRLDPRTDGQCGEHGGDEIEFLVSANPGQPPRPLARVASGGELSRISLALKVATLEAARLPCLVFDEVDAGVGGAVAEVVGRQLRQLAEAGQVLCVTHLAQVAAQADHQLSVAKHIEAGAIRTSVRSLDDEMRIEELARMLGGTRITATTREHAREMLAAARRRPRVRTSATGAGNPLGRSGRAGSGSGR
jgi:DNA repair protein RecN (Recombination protein N)